MTRVAMRGCSTASLIISLSSSRRTSFRVARAPAWSVGKSNALMPWRTKGRYPRAAEKGGKQHLFRQGLFERGTRPVKLRARHPYGLTGEEKSGPVPLRDLRREAFRRGRRA